MRLLLDTHAFLWFITDDLQLSPNAKALIADPINEIFVSTTMLPRAMTTFSPKALRPGAADRKSKDLLGTEAVISR